MNSRRKAYKKMNSRRHINKGAAAFITLILTCAFVLFFSFDLENGSVRGALFSDAKSVIDDSNKSEELRNARIDNYYQYIEILREEARLAAAQAEAERLEQERLLAELAAEQERLARKQRVTEYVAAVARGEQSSEAMNGVTFRRNSDLQGRVALSFDDGPFNTYTYQYLEVLEEYGVYASFFCQAQYVKRYPEQTQAIVDAGHELGCHSYAHAQMNKLSSDALRDEIAKCKEVMNPFQEILLFRYPYGAYNSRTNGILQENQLISVLWSVDPEDWAKDDPQDIIDHILENTKDGDIILLHEGKEATLAALPGIITGLREMGFEIVTVSELLYGDMDDLAVQEEMPPDDATVNGTEDTAAAE